MDHALKEDHNDEEVFFGKLSLKEIKKHILWDNRQRNTKYTCATSKDDYDHGIKIIETHSAPDLIQREKVSGCHNKPLSCSSLSPTDPEIYSKWEVKPVDDSFLKVEQLLTDLCVSPKEVVKKEELNNTLDIIDYILKNGAPNPIGRTSQDTIKDNDQKENINTNCVPKIEFDSQGTDCEQSNHQKCPQIFVHNSLSFVSPAKNKKIPHKSDTLMTPSREFRVKTPIFKTPTNTVLVKKPSGSTLKKTPMKTNAYQHIASPVASYIKNCPVAPLVKDVRPSKPLPGTSSIPKFIKNPVMNKPSTAENMHLPSVAYKSAKKTRVIDVPDDEKLPQSQLMKKITSSLPKPLVMKHNHREINLAKRLIGTQEENSFADLSLQQADVSVCTQKSAFNKPKKVL